MLSVHPFRRQIALCAILCAALLPAGVAVAARGPLAQERYYSSYPTADVSAGLAQERYLESYGEPQPLTRPQSSVPSGDTPWLPIALSLVGGLAILGFSATRLGRFRVRRHRSARSAT